MIHVVGVLFLISLFSLAAFLIGMFDPTAVVPPFVKSRTRGWAAGIYIPLAILVLAPIGFFPRPPGVETAEIAAPAKPYSAHSEARKKYLFKDIYESQGWDTKRREDYYNYLTKLYGLAREDVDKILAEGLEKKWPGGPEIERAAVSSETGRYTTNEGYFACRTEKDLDRVTDLMIAKDMEALMLLVETGRCVMLKGGVEVQRVDSTWTGKVEIRPIGSLDTAWTYYEAIK